MDHLSLPFTKASCCFLSLLAFLLQLLLLSQTSCSFAFINSNNGSSLNCLHHEKIALLQLKHGFLIERGNYNSSSKLDSWNPTIDCCSWEGVSCDKATGHVIGLDLSGSNGGDLKRSWIRGRIDSSLFQLHSLQKLNLAWNSFYPHPIPSELGQLTNLTHLNLSESIFTGQIPLEISRLTKLISLDLSLIRLNEVKNPNLTTIIQNLANLQELFLDWISFSEEKGGKWAQAISIALPNLRRLSLRGCGLQGPIDASLFRMPYLSHLSLYGNTLSSIVVPDFLGDSSSLTSLILSRCSLYGDFPKSFFMLPNLQKLDISYNPSLTIDFSEFPQNKALQILYMDSAKFEKKLLDSIGNLKFLKELSLSNCNLSGSLPSSITNLTQLELLDLSSNNFSGPIPLSYGDTLQRLTTLKLSYNSLEGSIPLSLFSHLTMRFLHLSDNQFSGWLPDFHNVSSSILEEIYLDGNKLQGPIPKSVFKLMKLTDLSVSNNNFSGTLALDMFKNFKNFQSLDLSDNVLSVINSNSSPRLISSSQIRTLLLCSCNISEFPNILQSPNQLGYLDLSKNKIHGKIPAWIWEVGNGSLYHLNLSNNFLESFEHPLPELSPSNLQIVDLHSNRLQGQLPIMPHRVYFHDYSNNNFSSIIPANISFSSIAFFLLSGNNVNGEIPLSICNSSSLQVLDLSRNNFSGNIPTCLGELSNSLKILNLQRNAFQGNVPEMFKKECSLRTLNLNSNELEGPIPRSLINCKTLEVLDLGNNHLIDTFPFWLETLSDLRILVLRSNKFHGPIAHSLTESPLFQFLQIFDLSSNFFMGVVPPELFSNWKAMIEEDGSSLSSNDQIVRFRSDYGFYYQDSVTIITKGLSMDVVKILIAMTTVDLSNNRFQGKIPKSVVSLKLLRWLNFSQNGFDGPIPASLENLPVLESLDLSRNKFSGEIPRQLTKLTFLAVLNLSENLLFGSIPQSQQFLTFTNSSFLGNIGLCGPPLSRKCEKIEATPPSAFDSSGLDEEQEIDWGFMWIGFGVGIVFGFGAVFWTLTLWRSGSRKYIQFIDRMYINFQ
ncbi:hypothetical protein AAC387_Pa07g1757 [Persea americana]